MTVKVSTKKVIASLEKRLVEMKEANKKHEAAEKEYEAQLTQYNAAVKSFVPTGKPTETSIRHSWGSSKTVEVFVTYVVKKSDLPTHPKRPELESFTKHTISEVENAIRILKMTDEETVNASTFRAVSRFL